MISFELAEHLVQFLDPDQVKYIPDCCRDNFNFNPTFEQRLANVEYRALTDDVIAWCEDHLLGRYEFSFGGLLSFDCDRDAALFKLTWL